MDQNAASKSQFINNSRISKIKESKNILLIYNVLSTLATEVWELETGNNKIITPNLRSGDYIYGIALYAVDFNFCSK